jgi:hypothetical protein
MTTVQLDLHEVARGSNRIARVVVRDGRLGAAGLKSTGQFFEESPGFCRLGRGLSAASLLCQIFAVAIGAKAAGGPQGA